MLRLLIDENFDRRILRGLRLRFPQLDYVLVHQVGMTGSTDAELLDWAMKNNRIIVTHDANTMTRYANARLKQGLKIAGLVVFPDRLEIGRAIADLEVISECTTESDLRDQIQYLPI